MRLRIMLIGLVLWICPAQLSALTLDIVDQGGIEPKPVQWEIAIPYGVRQVEGSIRMNNRSPRDFEIVLKTVSLTSGSLAFRQPGGEEPEARFLLGKSKSITQYFQVISDTGPDTDTAYAGYLQVVVTGRQPLLIPLRLVKLKPEPLAILEAKNNRLELVQERPGQSQFNVTLSNPSPRFRRVTIALSGFHFGGRANASSRPITVNLDNRQEKQLIFSFPEKIASGIYTGIFVLRDDYTYQEISVVLNHAYMLEYPPAWIMAVFPGLFRNQEIKNGFYMFIIIFFGALLSVALRSWFPTLPVSSNKTKIAELEEKMRALTYYNNPLQQKYTAQLDEIKTLNRNTHILLPTADERLNRVGKTLEELDCELNLLGKISDIYEQIDISDYLPYSIEEQIRKYLNEANTQLLCKNRSESEKFLQLAQKDKVFDKDHFCQDLLAKIKALQALHERNASDLTAVGAIKLAPELLQPAFEDELKYVQTAAFDEECMEKLRRWDRLHQKVLIYGRFFKTLELVKSSEKPKPQELENAQEKLWMLLQSNSNNDIRHAEHITQAFEQYRVLESDIEAALVEGRYSVVPNLSSPPSDGIVNFKLCFHDHNRPDIDKTPLIYYMRTEWNYGDRTSMEEAFGIESSHYYKRRGLMPTFRKWFRKQLVIYFPMLAEFRKLTVTVKPKLAQFKSSPSCYIGPEQGLRLTFVESVQRPFVPRAITFNLVSFGVVLFLSCLLVYLVEYSETPGFRMIKDFIPPFATGFGLEISRSALVNRLANPLKGKNGETVSKPNG